MSITVFTELKLDNVLNECETKVFVVKVFYLIKWQLFDKIVEV